MSRPPRPAAGSPDLSSVGRWLKGIEPAWTLLDAKSVEGLLLPPLPPDGALRLAVDLSPDELGRSPMARNAQLLLQSAAAAPGLKLTAGGNLSRAVVALMLERLVWPGFDEAEVRSVCKVINEEDVRPLYFLRFLVQRAGLVRKRKTQLAITSAGRQVLVEPAQGALQALLFHLAFWGVDLDYFGPDRHGQWPQCDVGIVLWSLSAAATDWQSLHRLTRLCTVPTPEVVGSPRDSGSFALLIKVLRPLLWFGLLEHREDAGDWADYEHRAFYRKSALFDRFLRFDVSLNMPTGPRH